MKKALLITRKELAEHLNQVSTYIVVVAFLLIWEFFFFRTVFVTGEATLRQLFANVPWLFLIFIPALVMGSFAKERSQGTLELLLTRPLHALHLILGKIGAYALFIATVLLVVVPIVTTLGAYGNFDLGVVASQYVASLFLATLFIGVGVTLSLWFQSQVTALLATVATLFLLVIIGSDFLLSGLPVQIGNVLQQLGVIPHYESMARGVIDLRDVWYFISVSVVAVSLGYLKLVTERFGDNKPAYRQTQTVVALIVLITIVTNIIGQSIPGRLDITENKIYTLSDGTKNVLNAVDDIVNIYLFASPDLPSQFQPRLRDAKDLLRDYETFSNGSVIVSQRTTSNAEVIQEAQSYGIQEAQFNVIGTDEFQVKTGYLGIAVTYLDKQEVIPFIQSTADLEYQLTSFINKLTTTEKPKVVFTDGHGEKTPQQGYALLAQQLESQFVVETTVLDQENSILPEDTDLLVVGGPNMDLDTAALEQIKAMIDAGKAVMVLLDGTVVDQQTLSATPVTTNLTQLLQEYGVMVNQNIAYDLASNETITFGGGTFSYVLPYPFWVRALANDASTSPVTARLESILLPWPSTITVDNQLASAHGFSVDYLFNTTEFAKTQQDQFSLMPDQPLDENNLAMHPLVVALSGGTSENSAQKARLVVVGDSDFLSEEFLQNSPENVAVGSELIAWLTKEESLANIQLKQRQAPRFVFDTDTQTVQLMYTNMGLVVLVPFLYAVYRLRKRNAMKDKHYGYNH